MALRVVRLGTPRAVDEGLRIGTVRRPPRGVPKTAFAEQDWYDCWYPNLAPSAEAMALGQAAQASGTEKDWGRFRRKYLAEMSLPDPSRSLDLLAALSHGANLSVGCYCEDASRCHRSLLRELLAQRGANLA
ncbi:DUF488 domain-containing protein [Pseudorhodoferax sp. Leaf267]|uniref:DUF488 domain-containing protein n=1 Tax=Pseudorhodoferax sp. Leaf267 TaxID=1736316 RepID=UPI0006F3F8B3|nr:DUF488 family protein [Pseudorhodoferax sp. Leaf267]KQP20051.1 hypothetical protein ASF43_28245 [Pseudorhodoferax sp. Leaf267]